MHNRESERLRGQEVQKVSSCELVCRVLEDKLQPAPSEKGSNLFHSKVRTESYFSTHTLVLPCMQKAWEEANLCIVFLALLQHVISSGALCKH